MILTTDEERALWMPAPCCYTDDRLSKLFGALGRSGWPVIRNSRPRLRMLDNPPNGVIFRNKALDHFCLTIGPQNIDPPASSGIFPSHKSWSLLEHPSIMRLRRPGSSQPSCHNQTAAPAKGFCVLKPGEKVRPPCREWRQTNPTSERTKAASAIWVSRLRISARRAIGCRRRRQ